MTRPRALAHTCLIFVFQAQTDARCRIGEDLDAGGAKCLTNVPAGNRLTEPADWDGRVSLPIADSIAMETRRPS